MHPRSSFTAAMGVAIGVLLVVTACASAASFPGIWRVSGRLNQGSLTGLACPSTRLCVAIDGTGDVLSSTNPAAGARNWTKTAVDAGNRMIGLACPSTTLCVAVDNAGNLATSTDPADGRWTVANLEGVSGFIGVACPSTSVCVAATASDLLVSKDPAAGGSSWTVTRNADTATGPECGKYGGDSGCAVSMVLLSCVSSSSCALVDDYGGTVFGDPVTGSWTSSSGAGLEVEALSCVSDGACLTLCAVAAGLGGDECTGTDYHATDLCYQEDCFTISRQTGSGLWCQSIAMCFAADGRGDLIASTDPTGGSFAWTTVYLGQMTKSSAAVTGLSCPSRSFCVAVNAAGQLVLGAQLPNAHQIQSLLARQLPPPRDRARPMTLLRRDGYSCTFSSPSAGRLTITWKTADNRRSRLVIARGSGTLHSSGTTKIEIHLTEAGKGTLRVTRNLKVTGTAKLGGAGGLPVTASKNFRLPT